MGRKHFAWARSVIIAGTILAASVVLPSAAQAQVLIENDHITITYAYDANGNRKSEVVGTVNPVANNISVSLSTSASNITVHTSGASAPYTATSHVSATASGGTPPYLYQWSPNQLSVSGANMTLANTGCSGTGLCGAGTASGSDTAILTSSSSCASGQTCTNRSTWIVQVTDQAGNITTGGVTVTHTFAP